MANNNLDELKSLLLNNLGDLINVTEHTPTSITINFKNDTVYKITKNGDKFEIENYYSEDVNDIYHVLYNLFFYEEITYHDSYDIPKLKNKFIAVYQSQLKSLIASNDLDTCFSKFNQLLKLDHSQITSDLFNTFEKKKKLLIKSRNDKITEINSMNESSFDMFMLSEDVNDLKIKSNPDVIKIIDMKMKTFKKTAKDKKKIILKELIIQLKSQLIDNNNPLTYTINNANNPTLTIKSNAMKIGNNTTQNKTTSLQINNSNQITVKNDPNKYDQNARLHLKLQEFFGLTGKYEHESLTNFYNTLPKNANLEKALKNAHNLLSNTSHNTSHNTSSLQLSDKEQNLFNALVFEHELYSANNPLYEYEKDKDMYNEARLKGELAKIANNNLEINLNVCNFVIPCLNTIIKEVNKSTTGGFVIKKNISSFLVRNLEYKDYYLTGVIRFSQEDSYYITFKSIITQEVIDHLNSQLPNLSESIGGGLLPIDFNSFIELIKYNYGNQKIRKDKVSRFCSLLLVTLVTNGAISHINCKNIILDFSEQNFNKFCAYLSHKIHFLKNVFSIRVKNVSGKKEDKIIFFDNGKIHFLNINNTNNIVINPKNTITNKKSNEPFAYVIKSANGDDKGKIYFHSQIQAQFFIDKFNEFKTLTQGRLPVTNNNNKAQINNKVRQFNNKKDSNREGKLNILREIPISHLSQTDKTYLLGKLNGLKYPKFLFGNTITAQIQNMKSKLEGGNKKRVVGKKKGQPINKKKKVVGVYRTQGGYYYRRYHNGKLKRISIKEYIKRK